MDFQKDSYGDELRLKAIEKFDLISDLEQLEQFKTELLGRKGSITELIKNISTLPFDEKKDAVKMCFKRVKLTCSNRKLCVNTLVSDINSTQYIELVPMYKQMVSK